MCTVRKSSVQRAVVVGDVSVRCEEGSSIARLLLDERPLAVMPAARVRVRRESGRLGADVVVGQEASRVGRIQDMERRSAKFTGALAGLPWAPAGGRCCGRPLNISDVEPFPPGYWEDESARRRCVLECGKCGRRYLGWHD